MTAPAGVATAPPADADTASAGTAAAGAVGTVEEGASDLTALLTDRAARARRLVVDMAASPRGCHLGGSLSVLDILVAALHRAARGDGTEVVLSKGHAAAGLYAALHVSGVLAENPAPRYGAAGHPYTGHPGPGVPGVRFPTGSLGHGVPYAVGWAMARQLAGRPGPGVGIGVGLGIAVVGDGELQEGLVWEACQVAAARRLGNFVLVVDRNGGQNDGLVADISPLPDLVARFASFGFDTVEVDGHDLAALSAVLDDDRADETHPLAVVATTEKGHGVPAVAGRPDAHYVTIDAATAVRWKRRIR